MKTEDKVKVMAVSFTMFAAVIVFVVTFVRAVIYVPAQEYFVPSTSASSSAVISETRREEMKDQSAAVIYPNRLEIPAISVNASVQEVGVTKEGNIGIPSNFTDVAWYKYGPMPGQYGNAVFDGHVDNGLSLPGVFSKLHTVKKGDNVYVVDRNGSRMRFIVDTVAIYNYQNIPSEAIFGTNDDAARIVLITCGGSWIKKDKTYDQRVIVTAGLV